MNSIGVNAAYTGENGNYLMTGLAPGDYKVYAFGINSYAGEYFNDTYYWNQAELVTVANGAETGPIDFILTDLWQDFNQDDDVDGLDAYDMAQALSVGETTKGNVEDFAASFGMIVR